MTFSYRARKTKRGLTAILYYDYHDYYDKSLSGERRGSCCIVHRSQAMGKANQVRYQPNCRRSGL